jgi:hypothetical protein
MTKCAYQVEILPDGHRQLRHTKGHGQKKQLIVATGYQTVLAEVPALLLQGFVI